MKIKVTQDLSNIQTFEEFRRYCSISFSQIVEAINGNISIPDNCNISFVSADFSAANTEVKVIHGLGRTPNGWFVVSPTAAMQVYKGSTTDTSSEIYVKSSAIGACSLLVF